jgi:hypothetical protein
MQKNGKMNKKPLYIALIITQVLLTGYPTYGAAAEVSQDPPMLTEMEQALKAIDEALVQQKEQGDEDIEKRMGKRADARDLQKKGEKLKKKVKSVTSPLGKIGTTGGLVASASGDLHLKMAAALLKVSVAAVNGLGATVAQIIIGVGRYQERSQEILSITELLMEDLRKSIEKIKALKKKQSSLLGISKTPQPEENPSALKQFALKLYNGTTNIQNNIQNKVQKATDLLTDAKIDREKKLKGIQDDLKKEKEHFSEIIKLLQIKLLQDAVKEIDKKINLNDTIAKLKKDIEFYENAKKSISTKSKSEAKKQQGEIDEKKSRTLKDLEYYTNFQKEPKELIDTLKKNQTDLIKKIQELTKSTKMGSAPQKEESDIANTLSKTDMDYLQSKEVKLNNPDANKQTVIALWSTIANLYREIDTLKKGMLSPRGPLPPIPSQRLNQNNANNPPRPPVGE